MRNMKGTARSSEERSDELTRTRALGNTTCNGDKRSEEQEPNEVLAAAISRERALSATTDKDGRTWRNTTYNCD